MTESEQPMATPDPQTRICPICGHENVPRASFCAKCGNALDLDAPESPRSGDEPQATAAYQPIAPGAPPEATWHEPEAERTSALPIPPAGPEPAATPAPGAPAARRDATMAGPVRTAEPSRRGFVLGMIAIVLILAVLALYIYAAWLGEGLREDIAGWMPW